MDKKSILFLCTGNSCRSQIAEAFCKKYHSDKFNCYSAGVEKEKEIDHRAVKVMSEIGIDISMAKPKSTVDLPQKEFDYVITLCSHAHEVCPYFPAKTKVIHHAFDDPPVIIRGVTGEENILNLYRRIRDEIKTFIISEPIFKKT